MIYDFDVIVVGSGPAGVSAAFPLVNAGLNVLMVDGGKEQKMNPPIKKNLDLRLHDKNQWKWMLGEDLYALKIANLISPKHRIPSLEYVFEGFKKSNKIVSKNFTATGSLATGGLSNAWGCGVACFSKDELLHFPFSYSEIYKSYENIALRIGLSGKVNDDLSSYFGVDQWANKPMDIDEIHNYLLNKYNGLKTDLNGFLLGRCRMAVLSNKLNDRDACNSCGNCFIGCDRKSMYSSVSDVINLKKNKNFTFYPGFIVDSVLKKDNFLSVQGSFSCDLEQKQISAKKIILAAGTLATTRLVLNAIKLKKEVPMLSSPTGAFMAFVPRFFGRKVNSSAAIGQIAFTLPIEDNVSASGATFLASSINASELLVHLPFKRRFGVDILSSLLSSCVIGNIFLPGHLTNAKVKLGNTGELIVDGIYDEKVNLYMAIASKRLKRAFFKMGAVILPGSFTIGNPGADVHYSGTLPMRKNPVSGETTSDGEVYSLGGVYVVDGASLPFLPSKPHTFTIMANADRIGNKIVNLLNHS